MAQATAKSAKAPAARPRRAAAKKSASAAKRPASAAKKATSAAKRPTSRQMKSAVDSTADLSQDVLKSVESGQRAAIDAVRKFVDTVDEVLPALGERPSRRQKVVDAALEMADTLVTTQYDFLRSVVRGADHSLGNAGKAKK